MALQNALSELWSRTFEGITGGFTNINSDHGAIHLGYGAITGDIITLTSGAVKEYCITTPSVFYPHFKNLNLSGLGGNVQLEIIRGATVTVNTGTDVNITNPNDNSDTVPEMTIKEDPTYSGGTTWVSIYALSDSTNQTTGNAQVSTSPNQELVMKNKTEEYILKITNLTSSTIGVAWSAFWYEEPQGLVEV